MPVAAAVSLRGVTRVYHTAGEGETAALAGVDLDILDNEFFTLLGPSGCGKTTLLRMVAGFDEPTEGHVLLFGQPIQGLPPHRRPVNTVFQSYALFPHMSVADNVGFALEMLGWPRAEREARVAEMLALVRLPELGRRKPGQLSGGQQQRVALARALAPRPKVLLLDEPLSALDLKLRKEMQIELKRLQRETGITFVFVTHDQEEALTMSDRIAVMRSGHVLQVGSPRDVYEHPRHRFVAQFIGETNLVGGRVVGEADGAALVDLDGGMRVTLRADGIGAGRPVTLAVRPERLRLTPGSVGDGGVGGGGWPGTVGEAVYSGTDTAYHVALDGGPTVVVREQNRAAGTGSAAVGERVSVVVEPDAWQVLED